MFNTVRLLAAVCTSWVVLFAGPSFAACKGMYHGRVIEAETSRPLEDAVVVVEWTKRPLVEMEGNELVHRLAEVVTNTSGEFSISARPGLNVNPFTTVQDRRYIVIFKAGYEPWPHLSPGAAIEDADALLCTGANVPLAKLRTMDQMKKYVSPGEVGLFYIWGADKRIPSLIRAINAQRRTVGFKPYPEP